jgi:hypothetical protein
LGIKDGMEMNSKRSHELKLKKNRMKKKMLKNKQFSEVVGANYGKFRRFDDAWKLEGV